jgi:hypothetical protein
VPWSRAMVNEDVSPEPAWLMVRQIGSLRGTDDPWEPFQLLDPGGAVVEAVREYLNDLQAAGRRAATQRSYGMDLVRGFPAPRGALTYPLLSREGLEVISLGPLAYLASKEKGDNSMPTNPAVVPRRMGRGAGGPA